MRGPNNPKSRHGASPEAEQTRKPFLFGLLLFGVVIVSALFALKPRKASPAPALPQVIEPTVVLRTSSVPNLTLTRPATTPTSPAPAVVTAPASHTPQDLMAELTALSSLTGPLTKEQAEKFKQDLEELVKQGPASVPAIREFLQKNVEFDYAQLAGGDQLGYSSLRASLFDTLHQIGGPEAQSAMLEALQTTALPTEMLELAKDLDSENPGTYRDQILTAARDALAMDAAGQLGTNREVGPAFHMLQTYGSANTIEEVAKTDPVNFYNALNLASLPDGQGLQSLVQMAQNSTGGSQTVATQMIAQLAGQDPQALDTLLQMAQNGQISNGAWMRMAPILGGEQYQIDSSAAQTSGTGADGDSGLNYSIVNSATTPDEINQRIALIDRCLAAVPADSSAANALQHQRDLLAAQLTN